MTIAALILGTAIVIAGAWLAAAIRDLSDAVTRHAAIMTRRD